VLFIAMRYVQGGDVGTLVHREGALRPSRAAAIISPVASALDAAHAAGLVHRDVKPANMLLEVPQGRPAHVYLSDFGLSKAVLAAQGLTATGQFLGTVDYVSPEQIQGGPVTGRADQYSLACSAFELLTGIPPFRRTDAMTTVFAQLSQPPPAVTGRRPDLPDAVDGVVGRALSKDPAHRYPTCQQFADALQAACGAATHGKPARDSVRRDTAILTAAIDVVRDPTEVRHPAVASDPTLARDPTPLPTPRPARHPSRARWIAALAAAAALAAVAIFLALPNASGNGTGACQKPRSARPVNWSAPGQGHKILALSGGQASIVEGMAFSPGGSTLAIGTFGGRTYLVSPATGTVTRTLQDPGSQGVEAVAFSCRGTLAVADKNGSAYLWYPRSLVSSRPAKTIIDPGSEPIRAVAFSPDGAMVAIGDDAGNTYLWRVTSPSRQVEMLPGAAKIQAVAFSPDGKTLATGDVVGTVRVWRIVAGHRRSALRTLADPAGNEGIQAVAFSQDGSVLAAGDQAGNTYLWRTAPGSSDTPVTLADPGPAGTYGTVALAFSGATLAAGGYTGQIYLWDTSARKLIGQVTDPGTSTSLNVQAVAFSGRSLAAGDTAGAVYLWQAR